MLSTLDGVFSPDGKRVAQTPPGRASPERLFVVGRGGERPGLLKIFDPLFDPASQGARWQSGDLRVDHTTPSPPLIAAGHLLWIDEATLLARKILAEGLGPTQRLGPAERALLPGLRSCRVASGWVLAVTQPQGPDGDAIDLYFPTTEGFSPHRRVERGPGATPAWTLSCSGDEARVAWAQRGAGKLRLTEQRCSASGCQATSAELSDPGDPHALLIPGGDSATLLWQTEALVWSRTGPLASLASTPPHILLHAPAGTSLSLADAEVFTRGPVALVLVHVRGARPHFYPLRFGPGEASLLDCP